MEQKVIMRKVNKKHDLKMDDNDNDDKNLNEKKYDIGKSADGWAINTCYSKKFN